MTDEPERRWVAVGDARTRPTHWRAPHVCINRMEIAQREPCQYCGLGKYTNLPGNACENCMNTGYANPTAEDLK